MRCYYAHRRRENPDASRLAAHRYWETHRAESKDRAKRWYEQHREQKKAASQAYKEAHREQINDARRDEGHAGGAYAGSAPA